MLVVPQRPSHTSNFFHNSAFFSSSNSLRADTHSEQYPSVVQPRSARSCKPCIGSSRPLAQTCRSRMMVHQCSRLAVPETHGLSFAQRRRTEWGNERVKLVHSLWSRCRVVIIRKMSFLDKLLAADEGVAEGTRSCVSSSLRSSSPKVGVRMSS